MKGMIKMPYPPLKKITLFIAVLSLISCAAMPPKAPQFQAKGDYSYVKEYMTWFVQKEMKDNDIVGLSIALVDDQKIVWQQGFGYADRVNKIEATPETLYRAGSISKVFNGMAVMKLVEAGKMDIDSPLVTYLPEFKIKSRFGNTDGITPRTIMTHHSGLPSDWIDGMWAKKPRPFTQLVHEINDEYVAYPPNTVMSYSNLGMTLLGNAVQNVSGQAYAQFLDQHLLIPMGMTNSRFETGITGSRAAKSYNEGEEVIEYPLGDIPAGGLNTTAVDLARLAMLVNNQGKLDERQILSPETLDAMFTVQNNDIALDLGNPMGLAWFIDDKVLENKEVVYEHGGAVIAHRAEFMVAPKSKLGVVVLANTGSADTSKIAIKLLQTAWEAKNGEKLPEVKTSTNKPSYFQGTYATLIGKVDVTPKSTNRYKVRSSLGNFNLNLEKDNQYRLSYRILGFIPIDLEELGEVGLTTDKISGHHVIVAGFERYCFLAGVKVEPHPIHDAWKNRLGQYKPLNPPEPESFQIKDIELRIEDDYLVVVDTYSGDDFAQILRTVNAQEAVKEGFGRGLGETIRIIKDDKDGEILTFSGLRFKRSDN
jgi:CubicO group peptidase (beta-lactamase class C family)